MFGGRCSMCCLCFWCTLVIAVTSLSYLFGIVRRKRNLYILWIYTLGSHVFGVDFPQSRCLPIRCSKGRRLVGTECKSVIQKARGLSYTMTLSFEVFISYHNMDKVNSCSSLLANFSVEEVLKTAVVRKMPLLYSDAYAMVAHVTTHQTVSVSDDDLALPVDDHRVEGDEEKDMYFEENTMSKAEAGVNANLTHANEEDISKVSYNWGNVILWLEFVITRDVAREEVESTALRLANEDWHVTCEETHVRLVPALRDRLYGRDTVISNTSALPSETKIAWENVSSREYKDFWTQTDRKTVTVSPFLLCPSLTFSWEDFIVNDTQNEMSKVTIFNVSISLSRSQYRVDNNGRLELCLKTFIQEYFLHLTGGRNKTRKHKMVMVPLMVIIEGYLSLTCVCLSLVSLLATLMTYTFIPSLRTLPGKNVMALCSNLFVAQALLQFGIRLPQQEEVCVVVGMLVHYSWLAALLWMNACSFHMRRVFTTMQVSRTSDTSHCCTRRFAGYLVYAQGVPLLIVGATAAGSILVSRGHEVGYGRRSVGYDGHVCYLSTPFLVGVAFVVPLALVIVINLILFLQAARSITHDAPVLRHRGGKAAKTGQQRGKDKGGRWAGTTRSEESSGVNTLVHTGSGAVYNTGSYMHKDVNGARNDGQTGGLQNRENVTGREERREGEGNEGDSCLVGKLGIDGRRERVDKSTREHSGPERQLKHGRRIKRGLQEAGYERGDIGLGFKEDEDGGSGCEECERGKCGPAAQGRRPDARDRRQQEQEVEPMLKVDNGHVSAAKFKAVPSFWRRNLNVCVRLSSLTGLFWTLGVLAEVLNLPVLRLVSVVANGSQGVLIAASYLPTRRVGRLYRHACSTCCLGPSKTTSNSQPVSNASTKNSSATASGINTASTGVGSTDHSSHGNRGARLLP